MKELLYAGIDWLMAGRGIGRRINGEPLRFPAAFARYYPACYEPDGFAAVRAHCRPGDTVLDLGAHLGLYTVLLSRRVGGHGKVFAFEPTASTAAVLRRVVDINGCAANVEICPEAVAGRTTPGMPFYDTGARCSNANSLVLTARGRTTTTVPTTTVDDFAAARGLTVKFLKVDVEGAELDVLRGAVQTLRSRRCAARVGLHPEPLQASGGSLPEVWELIQECRLAVLRDGRECDRRAFCSSADLFDVTLVPRTGRA